MEQEPTEYVVKTSDKEHMQILLRAEEMHASITTWYDEVFRPKIKYRYDEYSPEQFLLLRSLADELIEHFKFEGD